MVELAAPIGMEAPAVTVIILASSDDVAVTIESALAQDYSNFHCIVVEDEPITAFERAIAPNHKEGSVPFDAVPRKGGDCDSLNEAWRLAAGRYVAIVCSGDTFRSNWLSVSVAFMEANPETIVGYPDWILTDGRDNIVRDEPAPDYDFYKMVLHPSRAPGPAALIRRSVVSMPRLRNRSFRLSNGYETWLLLGLQGDFIHIPATIGLRRNDTSHARERVAEYLRAIDAFFKHAGVPKIVQRWRHSARAHISGHSPWIAARLLSLEIFLIPRARNLFWRVLAARAMQLAPKTPGVAIWFLMLAFPFNPCTTSQILLQALAKHSAVLTRFGFPAPICAWIGHLAERRFSAMRQSAQ